MHHKLANRSFVFLATLVAVVCLGISQVEAAALYISNQGTGTISTHTAGNAGAVFTTGLANCNGSRSTPPVTCTLPTAPTTES